MNRRIAFSLAWGLLSIFIALTAMVLLFACELQLRPVFGMRFCPRPAMDEPRATWLGEQARQRDLLARLHTAQMRAAALPICVPPQKEAVERNTEMPAERLEELRIPEKISELEGCWQSIKGDIPLVSDDERRLPYGNVRICFCFRADGRGEKLLLYTDGVRCAGSIAASLRQGTLDILQPLFRCRTENNIPRGHVRSTTTCTSKADAAAECTTRSLGRRPSVTREGYRRVSPEHCRWRS